MKRSLLILALVISPLAFTGCSLLRSDAPVTQSAKTFRTLNDTWTLAFNAYAAFCERVAEKKVTPEQETQADRAWNRFREIYKNALTVAEANKNAAAPDAVVVASQDFIHLVK